MANWFNATETPHGFVNSDKGLTRPGAVCMPANTGTAGTRVRRDEFRKQRFLLVERHKSPEALFERGNSGCEIVAALREHPGKRRVPREDAVENACTFLLGGDVTVQHADDAVEVGDQSTNPQCFARRGGALKMTLVFHLYVPNARFRDTLERYGVSLLKHRKKPASLAQGETRRPE